jgi:ribosomal protein L37E
MAMRSQTQRTLLLGFIASIIACAAVGVFCLVSGQFTTLIGQVMATTGTVAGTSILALIAAIPTESRRWSPIGPLGLVSSAVVLVMSLVGIWVEPHWQSVFWESLGICWVFAVAFPHLGLLSLARLKTQWNWVRTLTAVAIGLLALQISASIGWHMSSDEWYRGMGVLGIVVASGTIAVPILHRVSAIRLREAVRTTELALQITCPRCGKAQTLSVGKTKCGDCGLGFTIEIEEENCKKCGYPLYKIESAVCPECGEPIFRPAVAHGTSGA